MDRVFPPAPRREPAAPGPAAPHPSPACRRAEGARQRVAGPHFPPPPRVPDHPTPPAHSLPDARRADLRRTHARPAHGTHLRPRHTRGTSPVRARLVGTQTRTRSARLSSRTPTPGLSLPATTPSPRKVSDSGNARGLRRSKPPTPSAARIPAGATGRGPYSGVGGGARRSVTVQRGPPSPGTPAPAPRSAAHPLRGAPVPASRAAGGRFPPLRAPRPDLCA